MRRFHKITVAYPVTTNLTSQQTFSFSTAADAHNFRDIAQREGYKIVLHTMDNLLSVTDALIEIEKDIILTNDQLNYEEYING